MADSWYYVLKGNRHGPVDIGSIMSMVLQQELRPDDYVWKKGFENWKKVREVPEFQASKATVQAPPPEMAPPQYKDIGLNSVSEEERIFFVRVGPDRGESNSEYGPFNLKQLKKLFIENRINGKSFLFASGMSEWKILADFPEYQEVFHELPPVIKDTDRRSAIRKPFVARLLVQSNRTVYEGICRDISVGGMQVLMDDYKGKAGDTISINVHPENTEYHFTASGVVVRILEGSSGFSFRFEGLSEEAKRAVEKYVHNN